MKTLATLPQVVVALTLSMSIGLVGCQKKRSPKLGDGEGRYSDPVTKYDGKVFKLDTLNEINNKGGIISASETFKVQANTQDGSLVTYPAVNYRTDAKLVDSVPLLAKPNTTGIYEIHYNLSNTHLVVSKVAPEAYIPYQEKTYAVKLSDGRLSVPLFGYPIQAKVKRERVKNDLGESTSRLTERPVMEISDAQYVQIDFTRAEPFDAVEKVDTFPVSFFTGEKDENEWYFAATVISAPDDSVGVVGYNSGMSWTGKADNVVKFQRTQTGLEAITTVLDSKAKENDKNSQKIVFIPGEYNEFKVEKDGNFRRMKEEKESSDRIQYNKKKYIKLDFAKIAAPYLGSKDEVGNALNQIDVAGMKLSELMIKDNFISILLDNMKTNVRVQVAFLKKEKTSYKPLIYHADDNKYFGLMNTKTALHKDYRVRRDEDYKKMYLVSRFQPNSQNEIVYHLSKSTPDWIIPSAQKAIAAWNNVFEKNTGIKVVLNTQEKVHVGDIRYNILNFIDTKTTDMGLGGFGPTVTDPENGRIISATSTMHINTYRKILVATFRNYILGKTGAIPDNYAGAKVELAEMLTSSPNGLAKMVEKKFAASADQAVPAATSYSAKDRADSLKNRITWKEKLEFIKNERMKYVADNRLNGNSFLPMQREQQVMTVPDNVEETLSRYCPEISQYISKLISERRKYDENEIKVVEECAEKVIPDAMVSTVVHEMGHNFGLRHNFAGSSDYANFPRNEKGQILGYSSSIMDYVPTSFDRLMNPAPYDIAAIKYAYAGVVDLKDNKSVKLDQSKSIRENLNGRMDMLRTYRFCDDTDAYGFKNDPMCQLHDIGWTPELAVRNSIKSANELFMSSIYRYDRSKNVDPMMLAYGIMNDADSMMNHYNYWRVKLAEFMSKKKVYLDGISKEDYGQILNSMAQDPVYGPIYKAYKAPIKGQDGQVRPGVVDQIYNFLTSYAFLPNRYCLVQTKDNQSLELEEFDRLRQEVYAKKRVSPQSCSDENVVAVLTEKKKDLVTEFGYSTANVRYDLSENSEYNTIHTVQPYDAVSTLPTRSMLSAFATLRVTQSLRGYEMGLAPSFMDEPEYREMWLAKLFDRTIDGVNPEQLVESLPYLKSALNQKNLLEKFKKTKHFPKFKSEKDFIDEALLYTIMALNIPNDWDASQERMTPVGGTLAQSGSGGTPLPIGAEFVAWPGAQYSERIAKTYTVTQFMRNFTVEGLKGLIDFVTQLQLPNSEEALKAAKTGEMLQKMSTFSQTLQQASGGNEAQMQRLKDIFGILFPELLALEEDTQTWVQGIQQKIGADPSLAGLDQEKAAAKMNELAAPYLQASASELVKKFKPFKMEERIAELQKKAKAMKDDSDEVSAQQHLFLMFMIRR